MSPGAHRRRNALTGEWVLVSPHRLARPWLGENSAPPAARLPAHDATCTLCAGNARASGAVNPAFTGPFTFDNDFPALAPGESPTSDDLFAAEPASGICRVLIYSPRHDAHFSDFSTDEMTAVVDLWMRQTSELFARPDIDAVTLFENRGAMMGASNPHPHGQAWASDFVPGGLAKECAAQSAYAARKGHPLLLDVLERERSDGARIVCANAHFTIVTPFWAVWPFETLLLPHRALGRLDEMSPDEHVALGAIIQTLVRAYDRLFATPFPYSFGFHQRPRGGDESFVLHAHFYPPLLRSAGVRKHLVGFEMLGEPQRDLTPEAAAERLRALV
jgi:UDPglucose--hexose-1-phosphate uridylyltransferase